MKINEEEEKKMGGKQRTKGRETSWRIKVEEEK